MAEVESWNTLLDYGSTADYNTASWTNVAKVIDLDPPEEECSDINNTHLATAGHAKTYQAGLVEGGDSKITCIFTAAAYSTLKGFLRTDKSFRITYNDSAGTQGSMNKWNGYVKKVGPKVKMDDIVTFDVTFKVSGLVAFSAAS